MRQNTYPSQRHPPSDHLNHRNPLQLDTPTSNRPVPLDQPSLKQNFYKTSLTSLVCGQDEFGERVRLAYITEGEEVLIDQEGLYLLQKYSGYEVAFLGFLGHDELSRSFVVDIGLNLTSCQGNHFTNVYGQSQEEAIYIWSLPFAYTPKLKVFLLSCHTPQQPYLNRPSQILLDLTLMLCSTLALVNMPDIRTQRARRIFSQQNPKHEVEADQLDGWLRIFQAASMRIVNTNFPVQKEDPFWPRSLYCLQPFRFENSLQQGLQSLFQRCSYIEIDSPLVDRNQSIEQLLLSLNQPSPDVNPSYFKSVCSFLVDSLRSMVCKQYQGLRMNGNIVCKWLINSMKYMNKKTVFKVNKIFTSIFKELYEASLLFHTDNYDQQLQVHFQSEEPKSLDSLLETFGAVEAITLTSFNQNVINATIHQEYQQRLLDYIRGRQQLIIQVNFRKNKTLIADEINSIQRTGHFDPENIRRYIEQVKAIVSRHDHNPIELIVDKLLKYSNNLEQRIIDQKLKIEQQHINQLKNRLREKHQQLMKSKEVNDQVRKANKATEKQFKKQVKELQQFEVKMKDIRREIEAQRKFQKEYMISKESKKQVAEGLLEEVREFEQKVRENLKAMDEINKEYDYHPEILTLNKRLEDKEKQIRLLDRTESRINSHIQNSLIRAAIQKVPDSGSQIQKSTIRQVLQKPAEPVPERKPIKRLTSKK